MREQNRTVHQEIQANMPVFRAARRSDISMQIRSAMLVKGLKNVDIADRLGVSEANVSRWLRGNQNLSLDTLYQLADAVEEPLMLTLGMETTAAKSDSHAHYRDEEADERSRPLSAAAYETEASSNVIHLSAYAQLRTQAQASRGVDFSVARSELGLIDPDERLAN
jgi:transcriptional regulator with XRE-family HTH domain